MTGPLPGPIGPPHFPAQSLRVRNKVCPQSRSVSKEITPSWPAEPLWPLPTCCDTACPRAQLRGRLWSKEPFVILWLSEVASPMTEQLPVAPGPRVRSQWPRDLANGPPLPLQPARDARFSSVTYAERFDFPRVQPPPRLVVRSSPAAQSAASGRRSPLHAGNEVGQAGLRACGRMR